jgi:hypothetical protein
MNVLNFEECDATGVSCFGKSWVHNKKIILPAIVVVASSLCHSLVRYSFVRQRYFICQSYIEQSEDSLGNDSLGNKQKYCCIKTKFKKHALEMRQRLKHK